MKKIWQGCQNSILFVHKKILKTCLPKLRFLVVFGRWASILRLSGTIFWQGFQKCTLQVHKTFLRKNVFLNWITFYQFRELSKTFSTFRRTLSVGLSKLYDRPKEHLTIYLWKKLHFCFNFDIELSAFRRKKLRRVVKTPINVTFSNIWKKFFIGETL